MILPKETDASWKSFLDSEIRNIIQEVSEKIENADAEVTPDKDKILRFLTLDLTRVKVVIIGQDPYPQKGVATGRAFEVGPLKSWTEPFRNTSLRNIVRALYAADKKEFRTFNVIKEEIAGGNFSLLPPNELFKYWEQQGVLLLNTSFSCKIGKPGSHSGYWKPFTDRLLGYINKNCPDAFWFLWGNHARKAVEHLELNHSISTTHPMICHQRANDFLFGEKNVFEETSHLIDWTGGIKKASSVQKQKRLW
ncbi:uracil-DNA glycosylase [Marinilabilia salmonicolor]|uniref:uracil-DNA glycosylase n=1 Tax=Marinilabilia salmonicolor TaxID=989 RepID=UPI00029A7257|nr:uracil-DNA glycosylase [Marinilabilia salmonicolor]